MVVVELPHGLNFRREKTGIDPKAVRPGPVERFVLHLPGDQRPVVSISENGVLDKDHGGIPEGRVGGDILAVLEIDRDQRGRDVELGPAKALHTDGSDRLLGARRLLHQPVELVVAMLVDLVPVGTQADHAEMHRLEAAEGRPVVETQGGGPLGAETDPHLHRGGVGMSLDGGRPEEVERGDRQEGDEQCDDRRPGPGDEG